MEIEQKLMDKDISKRRLANNNTSPRIATDMFGQPVDSKSMIQADTMAALEITTRKIDS